MRILFSSGSDKRPCLGSAEVSLHLNNQDKSYSASAINLSEEASENEDSLNKILKNCDDSYHQGEYLETEKVSTS